MAYRDDDGAAKLRIEQLEGKLAAANDTIARLKGRIDERASDEMADALTKEALHIVREIDHATSDAGIETMADMFRQRLPKCQVAEVGRTLTCSWGTAELRVIRHDDRTEFQLNANDLRSRAYTALGGFGFAVLAGPFTAAPLFLGLGAPPWAALLVIPLLLYGGYLLMDKLTRVNVSNARTNVLGAFESAIEIAKEHEKQAAVRIDVAPGTEALAEAEAVAEAEAMAIEQAEEQARK